MRTIEQIKRDIRELEHELYGLQNEFTNIEFKDVDQEAYQKIQAKITKIQNDANNDIIYIKTIYGQLLSIRSNAEFSVRQNNDPSALETAEKVHQAFILLVEYNKMLDRKLAEIRRLEDESKRLVEKSSNKRLLAAYEKSLASKRKQIDEKRQELIDVESQHSASAEAKNRIIKELQDYQDRVKDIEHKINKTEAEIAVLSRHAPTCRCGAKMELKFSSKNQNVFWGCSNYRENVEHSKTIGCWDPKLTQSFKQFNDILISLNQEKKRLFPPIVELEDDEKEALQHSSLKFDEYPNILETAYSNYLFQSVSVPSEVSTKEHFDELLQYSRFRIFTQLPSSMVIDDKTRTIFSLVLRLLNRGVVLNSNNKTEAKINRHFGQEVKNEFLATLNDYVTYCSPQNEYDSMREKEFAEYFFPKLLGKSWATCVYTQMPIGLLLQTNEKKRFIDERVDFLVCVGNKSIIIELDGNEHLHKLQSDTERDEILRRNGYIVARISNKEVDEKSDEIVLKLKRIMTMSGDSALVSYNRKVLIANKIVHQVSVAIVKMLEEGHISFSSNLNLEINCDDFSEEEKKLILLLATEEVSELVSNFAKLYGTEINLEFFNENAESFWIQIGDGDDNRNTIVIRDIVLPLNYLCSIHPFALIFPDKDAISEELLEYFLQYVYGYAQFRPGQFAAIRRTLRKEESIVLLPTGSGKSVIYQLSSMLLPGITVVISPLRALIEDQVNNLAEKGVNNIASIFSTDKKSKEEMLKKAKAIMHNHSAMMLYIAPERMQMSDFRKEIKALLETNNFCLVAIDEAHCVSEWGHDFRAAYLQIGRSCRRTFKKGEFVPPIIALTGTASDNVLRDVKRDLEISNNDAIITPPTFDRPELHYSIISCDSSQKFAHIKELLDKDLPKKFKCSFEEFSSLQGKQTASGIIFTILAARKKESNYDAWTLFNRLNEETAGLQVGTYFSTVPHSLEGDDKEETWGCVIKSYAREFKENQRQLLVATKAFGMGIDKSNIRYVIHNSLSNSIEQYYQEVGRAGRDRAHSECIMLFSNNNDVWNETVLNPNLEWSKFKEEYDNASGEDRDDISPLMFFHNSNFTGTNFEKEMLFAVLHCLRNRSNQFKQYVEDREAIISAKEIYNRYLETTKKPMSENELDILDSADVPNDPVPEKAKNDIAKAIIRLVTLGIIKDYEYDYSKSEYRVFLGKINRDSVLAKYLIFVDGCSRGRADDEKTQLEKVEGSDLQFIVSVATRYINLVYETIEKGRRRALHSMFRLAKEATGIPDPKKQDEFIRTEIQNYLVKDDTVDLVKSSNLYAGIYEILNAYPLYSNDVIIDSIEQENAKKTTGYAARMLAADPYHPGLLYLRAITSIKSRSYHNADVVNDIVAAYENSRRYSIPTDVSITFLVKTMNLTFNSSCELFKLLWEKIDGKIVNSIVKKLMELSNDEISEHFKDYLLLHIASQSLRKMMGDKY